MDNNLLKLKLDQAQKDLNLAASTMEKSIIDFHYRRGYFEALQSILQINNNNFEKNTESQN